MAGNVGVSASSLRIESHTFCDTRLLLDMWKKDFENDHAIIFTYDNKIKKTISTPRVSIICLPWTLELPLLSIVGSHRSGGGE